jgi:hypothetical protein
MRNTKTLLSLVALAVACGSDGGGNGCPPGRTCAGASTTLQDDEPSALRADLLIVADERLAAGPQGDALVHRAAHQMSGLFPRVDLRVAVVSARAGEGCPLGELHWPAVASTCAVPAGDFLETSISCGGTPNFPGPTEAALACALAPRAQSCGVVQPLAVLSAIPPGSAFLRPQAELWVLIMSSEDDQSPAAISATTVMDGLRTLKKGVPVAVAVIAGSRGAGDPGCAIDGVPVPATPRLAAFASDPGSYASFSSLCASDPTEAVALFGESFATKLSVPCLNAQPLDSDPVTPGVQLECVAKHLHPTAEGGLMESPLPACTPGGPRPCWKAVLDSPFCPVGPHFDQERDCLQPPGTILSITCATCPPGGSGPVPAGCPAPL